MKACNFSNKQVQYLAQSCRERILQYKNLVKEHEFKRVKDLFLLTYYKQEIVFWEDILMELTGQST